jgi:hypothetical protein
MPFKGGDDEHQEPPLGARQTLSKCDGKSIWQSELDELRDYKWESTTLMDALILHHIDIPPLGIKHVHTISTASFVLHGSVYDVIIKCYLACTCIDFVFMLSSSIEKKGKYVPCKHLYFIFAKRMSCDSKVDIFIHQPTLSWNEVYHLLQKNKLRFFISMWWVFL